MDFLISENGVTTYNLFHTETDSFIHTSTTEAEGLRQSFLTLPWHFPRAQPVCSCEPASHAPGLCVLLLSSTLPGQQLPCLNSIY